MTRLTLHIPAMGSSHCANIVERTLRRIDGVRQINTDAVARTVAIEYNEAQVQPAQLKAALAEEDYPAAELSQPNPLAPATTCDGCCCH